MAQSDFFQPQDLEFYASVIGEKFENNETLNEVGDELKNSGVFKKVKHWALLLEAEGYSIIFKNYWQLSGHIRHYSWARIYPKGYENTEIYFTIGVGSGKDQQGNYFTQLEYKIDCQRKRGEISSYQVDLFDQYVAENCPEASYNTIQAHELASYSWDSLVEMTLDFIDNNTEHYVALVNLLWPNEIGVEPKIARLCWNDHQWSRPSGDHGKSLSTGQAFEKDKGYGYEEWLFDLDKQLDGYHYGFIQAFNKGNHYGKTYDLQLYTIFNNSESKQNEYYWVGHIPKIEVLTKEERDEILNTYKENGWYDEMLKQLNSVGIESFNFNPIVEEHIFNVRFKVQSGHFTLYRKFEKPVQSPEEEIGGNRHYVLLPKRAKTEIDEIKLGEYQFRKGNNQRKQGIIRAAHSRKEYKKSLFHNEMQEKIYEQLAKEFEGTHKEVGTEVPAGFGTMIDVVVEDNINGDTFYEIKTGSNALSCIRVALGQILEYCFYPGRQNASTLIIVSPHKPLPQDKEYIMHLRSTLGIELYYQQYLKEFGKLEDERW